MKHPVMSGNEQFRFQGKLLDETAKDFWAWAMSRLLADGPRGDLAEFIVNTALGIDTTNAKRGWGECDILYNGIRIEVKCSSLLQVWERKTPTKPVFSIAKTKNCDIQETETGYRYIGRDDLPPERRSELYVFCLFANTDRATADPMDLDQWKFYIVPTQLINEKCADKKSISLSGLAKLGCAPAAYGELKSIVDSFVDEHAFGPFDSVKELMDDLNK
ncbi:MAG: hypothetical protein IJ375_05665 [Oscillospiraceae bacterium]|nr:hypothetical protein [Oscillospiraceae bacterium]